MMPLFACPAALNFQMTRVGTGGEECEARRCGCGCRAATSRLVLA